MGASLSNARVGAPPDRHSAYDPWSHAEALGIPVHLVTNLAADEIGATDGRRIWLHAWSPKPQLRSTLAHEIVHCERGIPLRGSAAEERIVEDVAASRLVTPDRFADVDRWLTALGTAWNVDKGAASARLRVAGRSGETRSVLAALRGWKP